MDYGHAHTSLLCQLRAPRSSDTSVAMNVLSTEIMAPNSTVPMKEPRAVFEKYLMLRLEMIPELYKTNVEHPVVLQSLEIQNQNQTTPNSKVTTSQKGWYIQET